MIITCDCADCYNMDTNYDKEIYYVSDKKLKNKLGFTYENNICEECVNQYNMDYENMIIEDPVDSWYVILNPKYKENT